MNTSIGNPPGWKALDVTLARNTEDTYTLISQWSRGMLIITYHGIPLHPWSLHPRFMWSASASNHKNIDYQFHQNKALKCSRQFFFQRDFEPSNQMPQQKKIHEIIKTVLSVTWIFSGLFTSNSFQSFVVQLHTMIIHREPNDYVKRIFERK